MQDTLVSLIISTYNWPKALEKCLLSILIQKQLPNEVLVADDGSGQETRQLIERYKLIFPVPIKHIWHEDQGFRKSKIINEAVRNSSFDYLIQIDGDVILHPYFVKDHIAVREEGVFIRGTRAMLSAHKTQEILETENIKLTIFSKGLKHRINALWIPTLKQLGIRKENSSKSVRGSNLAFWKSDFILINGYNNELEGWGHEDEELAARFINNDIIKKIVKLCAIQYHLHHKPSSRINEKVHAETVKTTVTNQIRTCVKGYNN
ncbi:glycosyltransferase family 2 protein [Arcticibacter eurypsychrophilus]|uniref:glycosyltransferase family 2 protein n=1 Tax=Arcticibacter eurypsychrophilus TaxID=1434752 RepID=UPI00084D115A|nr:glycosyltransferase family 2 protein [Arcticibacter eurypsychrophilus]